MYEDRPRVNRATAGVWNPYLHPRFALFASVRSLTTQPWRAPLEVSDSCRKIEIPPPHTRIIFVL